MLEYFRKRMEERGEAVIVYLGGSITEGQGVEDKRLCWQGLLQSKLEETYPECVFSAYNAGIGGTDSRFGAFRMERDVLCRRPDLLLIEFAVNDYGRPTCDIRESLEGILIRLWREIPECDVVFVLTATGKMAEENQDPHSFPFLVTQLWGNHLWPLESLSGKGQARIQGNRVFRLYK